MQSIFGHGLVNSTAAGASIGNYIFPTGNNLSNSHNLSKSKLKLPSGLPLATQHNIINNDFVVFDSFDGARFSVKGNIVFETQKSAWAPLYRSLDIVDMQKHPSLNFIRPGKEITLNKWAPRYLVTGDSKSMVSTDSFWGKKSSFFTELPIIEGVKVKKFVWDTYYGGVNIQPFIQIQKDSSDKAQMAAHGLSVSKTFGGSTRIISGLKIADQNFDSGITSDLFSVGKTQDLEFGIMQELSDKQDLFRMAETKINDLQASDSAFGFRGAKVKLVFRVWDRL